MKVKRLLLSISVFILVFLALFWIDFIPSPVIEFYVCFQQKDTCQVFEGEEIPEFTDENSTIIPINAGETTAIRCPWRKDLAQLRIDLGNISQAITLSGLSIRLWKVVIPIPDTQRLFVNDLEILSCEEGTYMLQSSGTDPYIIFSTKDAFDAYEHQMRKNIWGIAAILAFLLSVSVFRQYNRSKILIFWAFDILKNLPLIFELAVSDFKTRYAASYLGTIWAFVQPIVTILIYVIVFGYGFKSTPIENFPFVLWLSAGIIPWLFFSEAMMSATTSLKEYSYLVKKVVFEVKILPLVKIAAAFYIHLFFIGIVTILYIINGYWPNLYFAQLIYYAFCTLVLVLGFSYITAALNVFVPDLIQIINIALQFGMWMTPIMWSKSMFGPNVEKLLQINPLFYIVEGYRDCFYNRVPFWDKPGLTIYFWCVTLVLLIIGMYTFRKLERHFADVL